MKPKGEKHGRNNKILLVEERDSSADSPFSRVDGTGIQGARRYAGRKASFPSYSRLRMQAQNRNKSREQHLLREVRASQKHADSANKKELSNLEKKKSEKKTDEEPKQIKLEGLKVGSFKVRIVGKTPLICHRFSEKNIDKMKAKQEQNASVVKQREQRKPEEEYRASLYALKDGRFGFPASAFKGAICSASRQTGKAFSKAFLKGAFHVIGDIVPINGTPHMRQDIIKLPNGAADLRYRGQFDKWEIPIEIVFNKNTISAEQIVMLLHLAGFASGIGDWRPEKGGSFGMFEVKGA